MISQKCVYIVETEFPPDNMQVKCIKTRKAVGVFTGHENGNGLFLFQFPSLAGLLHNGSSSGENYKNRDVWWIYEREIKCELKQGKKL